MPISPLGGIACKILLQILEASTRFPICFHCNLLSISYHLKVIRHVSFGWDLPIPGQMLGIWGPGDPQNLNCGDSNPQKALPQAKLRRLSYYTSKSAGSFCQTA